MSQFHTTIPVDIKTTLAKLPPSSHIHSVTFDRDKSEILVHWEHSRLVTKYTGPVPFPAANLEGDLPEGVTLVEPKVKPAALVPPNGITESSVRRNDDGSYDIRNADGSYTPAPKGTTAAPDKAALNAEAETTIAKKKNAKPKK